MDNHIKALEQLCRICGSILKSGSWACLIADNVELFSTVYRVNFPIKEDLFPQNCCHNCYSVAASAKKAGSQVSNEPVKWKPHTDEVSCDTLYSKKQKGSRPPKKKKITGRPKKVETISDIMNIHDVKQITPDVEKAVANVLKLKAQSSSTDIIQFKSGGPQPLSFTRVVIARKDTTQVSSRVVRSRTKKCREVIETTSGSSGTAVGKQTAHLVNQLDREAREQIISNLNTTVTIPAVDIASMKCSLGIPWNKMRDIKRWFATFKVKFAPEKYVRLEMKEWLQDSLICEELPASFLNEKKQMVVKAVPLGGDHGQGSFKMNFQVANSENPNKPENTVLFDVMEAKDMKSNLILCLQRFKDQVQQFYKVNWNDKSFRLFFFGDYEFLCANYGISGASGRHCCLWCHITQEQCQKPPSERGEMERRSLETLKRDYIKFIEKYGGNIKNAKLCNNVIAEPLFSLPLDHVCLPGLHITLDVFLKMFRMYELFAKSVDLMFAKAATGETESDTAYAELVNEIMKKENEKEELEERRALVGEEMNWLLIVNDKSLHLENYETSLVDIDKDIQRLQGEIEAAEKKSAKLNDGPCFASIDLTVKELNVEREKYFGGTFVGNDCKYLLEKKNLEKLFQGLPDTVKKIVEDNNYTEDVCNFVLDRWEKFKLLFLKYAECNDISNCARYIPPEEVKELERRIVSYMTYLRPNFPNIPISPKMHTLEDHMVEFVSKWCTGCGFFGEQGGESIHSVFKNQLIAFRHEKKGTKRLYGCVKESISKAFPVARKKRVRKVKRNLTRNHTKSKTTSSTTTTTTDEA